MVWLALSQPGHGHVSRHFFGKIAVVKPPRARQQPPLPTPCPVAIRSSFIFIRGNRIKNCFPPAATTTSSRLASNYRGLEITRSTEERRERRFRATAKWFTLGSAFGCVFRPKGEFTRDRGEFNRRFLADRLTQARRCTIPSVRARVDF